MTKHKCYNCGVVHDTTDWVVGSEYWKCAECSQFAYQENWAAVKEEIDISKIEIGDEIQGTQGLWRTVMGMNYLSFDCGSHAVLKSHVIAHRPKDDTCPKCGGEADNGFDRQVPPNAYYCTKCESKEETPGAEPCTQCTNLKDVMGEGVFCPKHGYPPFTPEQGKMVWVKAEGHGWSTEQHEYIGSKEIGDYYVWLKGSPSRFDAVTNTDPHAQPARPDYLREDEELWEYKDDCYWGHYGSSYDYTMILNMGYRLIGYAVEDGYGEITVRNTPHWYTYKYGTLFVTRWKGYYKARIVGAVMLKEADK